MIRARPKGRPSQVRPPRYACTSGQAARCAQTGPGVRGARWPRASGAKIRCPHRFGRGTPLVRYLMGESSSSAGSSRHPQSTRRSRRAASAASARTCRQRAPSEPSDARASRATRASAAPAGAGACDEIVPRHADGDSLTKLMHPRRGASGLPSTACALSTNVHRAHRFTAR